MKKLWTPTLPQFKKFKKKVFIDAAKVSEFIYQIGEYDHLRKESVSVNPKIINSNTFQSKLNFLKKCLLKYRKLTGFGRAATAVQVGIPEKFAVVLMNEKIITIINPKITNTSGEKLLYPEICMSANPIIVPLIRPAWVEFEYFDEFGQKQHWNNKGKLLNRVFQHEIDHMYGIINIDLVKNPKDLILLSDPKFYDNAEFKRINK